MKILSLWQPWASLLVGGAKMIETRSWSTTYRGPIAVHASKYVERAAFAHVCYRQPFAEALARMGFNELTDIPLGSILGRVDLVDCLKMGNGVSRGWIDIRTPGDRRLTSWEREFGNYELDRFAWMTGPSRLVLPTPIPWRGTQGLRDLDPEVARRLA